MTNDFAGKQILAFESRKAQAMIKIIEKHAGVAISAPAMQEVPLDSHSEALQFTEQLLDNNIDAMILLTGVGTKMFIQVASQRYSEESIIQALARIPLIARGPKVLSALRTFGLTAKVQAPEPNTWQSLLEAIDAEHDLQDKVIAVQEYGQSNLHLLQGLEQRGATVLSVPIYRWELPDDTAPLLHAIHSLIASQIDCVLFTTATQLDHLLSFAESQNNRQQVVQALQQVHVGSIGPVTSEALRTQNIPIDYEPETSSMAHLVKGMAQKTHGINKKDSSYK